jgi:glycosyltransferase involved in cell wall biosynthesis
MGWSAEIEAHCGPPPEWAECLKQGAETSQEFLSKIHCLVQGVGCCAENWPRIGLEAMAAGVPVVAERKGGWNEMLPSRWCGGIIEQAEHIDNFARNENERKEATIWQRNNLRDYADAVRIGQQWLSLFEEARSA